MKNDAAYYFKQLDLKSHPEGGAFSEVYRSVDTIPTSILGPGFEGVERVMCTSIFFLLQNDEFSAFHRIRSDETWHFYDGDPLVVAEIDENGKYSETILGRDLFNGQKIQYTVKKNRWFGSYLKSGGQFSLTGCTVSPGFDFRDFEMADYEKLCLKYPELISQIRKLTR